MAKPELKRRKVTIRQLREMKAARRPIVALGVYESVTASLADELGVQILMTGPSGPMSLFGRTNVAEISFDEQLTTLRSVSRVTRYALINAHMPFLSYHASERDAIVNAGRLLSEGGADTVKCDATRSLAKNIRAIIDAGIPVIAHIGVQASRRAEQSGFSVKGATAEDAKRLVDDAHAIAAVGVFAFLVEHVCAEVMTILTQTLPMPVLSLGSGGESDGACVVSGDLMNYSALPAPAHAGRMVDLRSLVQAGLSEYAAAVRARTYPKMSDAPHMSSDEHEAFLQLNRRGT